MQLKSVLAVLAGLASLSIAAPIGDPVLDIVEREASLYGTAHTLKMAEDEFKKRDRDLAAREPSLYGTAHTLKMAEDEFKKRAIYRTPDEFKVAEHEVEKRDPSLYGSAHTLKMAEDEF